jgi:lipopolysaccharide/colanic/teichoic acid biosynthesis glycosyltransferase
MTKRLFDCCAAALALVVSLPLLLVVALAVKLDSAGPVLFTTVRVGRGARPFRLFKFRSMFADSDKGSPITSGVDDRITRVGRVIRPLRIDELPQLFNVLRGDMSLVGPRPEAPSIVERYTLEQRNVFKVRPGVTGPTQLDWLDEATRLPSDAEPMEYYVTHLLPAKLAGDLHYVRTRTFAGDIRLLLRTPFCLGHSVLARPRLSRLLKITRRRPA